jgi:hypothetical protein
VTIFGTSRAPDRVDPNAGSSSNAPGASGNSASAPLTVTKMRCASGETAMPFSRPAPMSFPPGKVTRRTATTTPSCRIRTMVPLPRLAT